MSRSMLLVFLFVILIITSQFEWRQQLVPEVETAENSQKQQQISKREEAVKEQIILSQERNIQRLNEVVRSLREELQQCKGSNKNITNGTTLMSSHILELQRLRV
ncbi:uncharacterized protein LOC111020647 [Momordica charantia]|uniref:Uncharacterized protein LOC111020647 n=1 Tax=Momordica charantia TaxID=3673 RepID=A0A6J1DHW9_MOMCH|nr:uncharacterized protein LOC111020647 [Momordica charantia]XP_022153052.1 uncharacterized protein LOC111020647 [Momordica charantia]